MPPGRKTYWSHPVSLKVPNVERELFVRRGRTQILVSRSHPEEAYVAARFCQDYYLFQLLPH